VKPETSPMAATKKEEIITTPTGTDKGLIVQQITVRPVVRTRSDIAMWRSATIESDWSLWQIRVRLYDLYEDCLLDPVLSDQIDKAHIAVTGSKLQFMRDGEEVDEIKALIETEAFDEMLKEIVNTILWGYSVFEFSFDPEFSVVSLPRKHIRPLAGEIAKEQYDATGIPYRVPPASNFIIECGKQRDLGKLLKAVPYALYKRGGMADLAQFSEIFGQPIRVAKYDASNAQARAEVQKVLDEAGAALAITIPKEVELELKSPTANITGEVYKTQIDICDKQMMILINGQTETTMSSNSSGYAQSKTHMETADEIKENVRKYVARILNSKVRALLDLHGFPVKGGEFKFVKDEEEIAATDKIVIWNTVKNMGVPIGDDDVYEEFGIPKPKDYTAQKAQKDQERQQQLDANNQQMRMIHLPAKKFFKHLSDFFARAPK